MPMSKKEEEAMAIRRAYLAARKVVFAVRKKSLDKARANRNATYKTANMTYNIALNKATNITNLSLADIELVYLGQ